MSGFMKNIKEKIISYSCDDKYRKFDIVIWMLLGAEIFVCIYGITPLNFMNDHWLFNGYVELDATQHYSGWLAYRQSNWTIPLGKVDGLGGTVITYTDSIPWVAILFKCFSGILPETFQYFGIYVFCCIILQAISSGLLISLFSNNKLYTMLGVVLFCCSPIMLERAFRHTALASHWLILFMLYFYFRGRKNKQMDWRTMIIPVIAIGIHPYFLPIVFGIMFANVVESVILDKKNLLRSVLYLAGSLLATIGSGYLIGALGTSSSLTGEGYGFYSMNLNAISNPISCGNIVWSRFLNVLPQILGNYDGFNYLGVGVILGIIVLLLFTIIKKCDVTSLFKENIVLIVLCVGFWLFAISNVVTLNQNILFIVPLPNKILSLAAIFRASSRIFYPVFYLIFLAVVIGILKFVNKKYCLILLFVIVVVQLIDISPALQTKHESFKVANIEKEYNEGDFTGSPVWNDIAKKQMKIRMLNNAFDYRLAAFGEKNKLSPDISVSSNHFSGGIDLGAIYQDNAMEVVEGNLDDNCVYVLSNDALLNDILKLNSDVSLYNDAGYYIITSGNVALNGNSLDVEEYKRDYARKLIGDHWIDRIGDLNDESSLLFDYSEQLLDIIKKSIGIRAGDKEYQIINYESDGIWLRVIVDANVKEIDTSKLGFVYKTDFYASELTDDNWTKGISNFENCKMILFDRDDYLLAVLEGAENIICGEQLFNILNVEHDEMWIRVEVDRDASDCQYPNLLTIK